MTETRLETHDTLTVQLTSLLGAVPKTVLSVDAFEGAPRF